MRLGVDQWVHKEQFWAVHINLVPGSHEALVHAGYVNVYAPALMQHVLVVDVSCTGVMHARNCFAADEQLHRCITHCSPTHKANIRIQIRHSAGEDCQMYAAMCCSKAPAHCTLAAWHEIHHLVSQGYTNGCAKSHFTLQLQWSKHSSQKVTMSKTQLLRCNEQKVTHHGGSSSPIQLKVVQQLRHHIALW